jgi:hypothetical protein
VVIVFIDSWRTSLQTIDIIEIDKFLIEKPLASSEVLFFFLELCLDLHPRILWRAGTMIRSRDMVLARPGDGNGDGRNHLIFTNCKKAGNRSS